MTGPRWSPYCGLHADGPLSLVQWIATLSTPGRLANCGRLLKSNVAHVRVATESGLLVSEIHERQVRAGITEHGVAALALGQPSWVYGALRTWPRVDALRYIAAEPGCQAAEVAAHLGASRHCGPWYVHPLIRAGLAHCHIPDLPRPRTQGWSLTITPLGERMLVPLAAYSDPTRALAGAL